MRVHLNDAQDKARRLFDGRLAWGDNPDDFFNGLNRLAAEIEDHVLAALEILDNSFSVGGLAAAYPGAPKPRQQHRLVPDPATHNTERTAV